MHVQPTDIPEVKWIEPPRHGDPRGYLSETWSRRRFEEAGIRGEFVQDNHSYSQKVGTLRGLHFQIPPVPQAKLVRVARGAILDVAVDIRRGSPTFGAHVAVELSEENWRQLWVPEGFAHGFVTRVPDTIVLYKVTGYYAPESERGIRWDDPTLAINWGLAGTVPELSTRDAAHAGLEAVEDWFRE